MCIRPHYQHIAGNPAADTDASQCACRHREGHGGRAMSDFLDMIGAAVSAVLFFAVVAVAAIGMGG